MTAYLEELAGRLSAASVASAESCLRQFALHVMATDSSCISAADVTAIHVGGWCVGLSARWGSRRKRPVTAATINQKLDVLRRFFEHIREAGYPDAPEQLPIFRPPRKPRPPKPNIPTASPSCFMAEMRRSLRREGTSSFRPDRMQTGGFPEDSRPVHTSSGGR
jgi:hypothetical protein